MDPTGGRVGGFCGIGGVEGVLEMKRPPVVELQCA